MRGDPTHENVTKTRLISTFEGGDMVHYTSQHFMLYCVVGG